MKSCSAEPFSPEMTVLVCEPIIHAVAYCDNKAFFNQASEALIQGLLPGGDCEEDCGEECGDECGEQCGDHCDMTHEEESECSESENDEEGSENDEISNEAMSMQDCSEGEEEADFDSEEFDNIKDDGSNSEEEVSELESDASELEEEGSELEEESHSCCSGDEHDHSEDEEEKAFIFDYSLLSKFIFDFGAREDVLIRNRRFLYELSQIIEEVSSGVMESCCQEGDSCCN